jgi:hypothetical protein
MRFSFLRRVLVIGCLAVGTTLHGQVEPYQVFFVAVGSGWYAPAKGNEIHGFPRILGANASAELVASELNAGGAEYGVEVKSGDQKLVTLADIEQAIGRVKSKILATKPSNPLLIFYVASHGISEGIAWSHFSIPGDFVYRGDPDNLDIESLSNSTLHAGSLVDELEKLRIPFVVFLDSCTDGKEKHFEPSVLSAKATRNLNEVGAALRVMNEFRNSYPVLFSTTPGQSVSTVVNPFVPGSAVNIAPLARRFGLAVRPSLEKGEALSLAVFLQRMISPQLDTLTTPAVTHSKVPAGANVPFLRPSAKAHAADIMTGTGSEMKICCAQTEVGETAVSESRGFTGSLSITGAKGEYVSSGGSLQMNSPAFKVMVTQPSKGDLQIRFEREDTEFDACFSTGSDKGFEVKEYKDAQRCNMADAGHPALEISGDGRGCGEIAGSFQLSNIVYGGDGQVLRFAATFMQFCDDSKIPARGSVELSAN